MAKEYINPPELAPSPMNIYNHVVKVGNTVYIAGQVPRGLDGKAAHVGDPVAQIRMVWSNLEIAVKAAGGTLARSFCAFTAVFWGLRLFAGLFVFDASEYLTSWFYKAGYHGLTLVFIYQTSVYGYCAFAPGIN